MRITIPGSFSRDEAVAHMYNLLARRLMYFRRFDYAAGHAAQLPLATWIVGAPESRTAPLAAWFVDEPPNTNYRLMLHWIPSMYAGCQVVEPWSSVHAYKHIPVRHRSGRYSHQRDVTAPLLKDLLEAARAGPSGADDFIRHIHHDVASSISLKADPV